MRRRKEDRAGRRIPQPACTSPTSKPGHNCHDDDDDYSGINNDLFWISLNLLKDGGEDGNEEVEEHHVANQHVAGQERKCEIASNMKCKIWKV